MSLKSDLKKAKMRQKEADKIKCSIGNELQAIAERILKGETTGNALDDFCIVYPSMPGYFRKLDADLGKYRKDLVMLVHEDEIQTSCSITHGTYDWVQNYTLGVNLGHDWNAKKGELLLYGRFAERKYHSDGHYKDKGDELKLDTHTLALVQISDQGSLYGRSQWGSKYHLFVGDEAKDTIMAKRNFKWHAWADIGSAFKILGYKPDKDLAEFARI